MNAINRAVTKFFDLVLTPLEAISDEFALLFVSGVFGVLALWIFKHISWQKGIKATKNKIKGHLIEIRLYQDDLVVVSKAILKVLWRNVQYLFLNFGPFIPLAIPFALVAAQMVVRYGFEPADVQQVQATRLAGDGITLSIEGDTDAIADLSIELPEGLTRVAPLPRIPGQKTASTEFFAEAPGVYDIVLRTRGQEIKKRFVAGAADEDVRTMQPERVTGFLSALLWPAEDTLEGTGLTHVAFVYPESDLGWLPFEGPGGVLIIFVLASMVVGFLALKPLGVQI
ncbi:hypothetical protein Poly30_49490 [Planctomycetes bacterium Poly30]|uniref:Uncharacterized protein n=1 Tax=Saltatorellus ferox TaxID=2528018 RepID=A0A518EZ84_9BACT|nr:hypothetical protein Poly30_49490 [Planctomycetes bacterium Poly30]